MTSRLTTVLATVGATGALVAGGLAFGGSPAAADGTSFTYNCNTPVGAANVTVAYPTALSLPTTAKTNNPLPSFNIPTTVTIPSSLGDTLLLAGFPSVDGTVGSNYGLGSQSVPVTTPIPSTTITKGADTVINTTGKSGSFVPNAVGTFDLMVPSKLNAVFQGGAFTVPCTLVGTPTSLGQITVAKGATPPPAKPVISASAPKTAKAGKSVTVKVVVKNAKTGKVTAKLGKRAFTAPLKAGKASVVVKGIKKGVNKIVVSFPKAASKTLKVTGK